MLAVAFVREVGKEQQQQQQRQRQAFGNEHYNPELRQHTLETLHPATAASRHHINFPSLHKHTMAPKRKRNDKKGMSTSLEPTSLELFKHH